MQKMFSHYIESLKYCAHLFTSTGLRPDLKEVKAIAEKLTSSDKRAVPQFLGLINYTARFNKKKLAEKAAPLRQK